MSQVAAAPAAVVNEKYTVVIVYRVVATPAPNVIGNMIVAPVSEEYDCKDPTRAVPPLLAAG